MSTPSIVPNDRLDKDFYLVLEESGAAFRETDEGIDYTTLLNGLLSGEYRQVFRVVAMNPAEGWSRDASEDVAHASSLGWRPDIMRSAKRCAISSKARPVASLANSFRCSDAPGDRPDDAGSFGDLRGGGGRKSNDSPRHRILARHTAEGDRPLS